MPENYSPKQPKEIDVFNRFSKFNKLKIILMALGISIVVFLVVFFLAKTFTVYTLTFETYGGTIYGEEVKSQEYRFLQKTVEPKPIKKEGYYIEGYYTDSDFKNEYKFGKRIWKSNTIHINWQPGYAVQLFFAEGEDDDDRNQYEKTGINLAYLKLYHEQYVKPGSTYSLPYVYNTIEGNKHNGEQLLWYDNPECEGDPIKTADFVVDKNIQLYGVWFDTSPSKFDITSDGTLKRYLGECYNIYLPSSVKSFKRITENFETGLWNTVNVADGSNYSIFDKVMTDVKRIYINPECEELGECAFRDCVKLEKVVFLGNKIEKIPEYTFTYCESLREVKLPDTVKTIDKNAFYVSSIKTISGIDNVETIGKGAFSNCNKLNTIEFKNVTTIYQSAFASCVRLKNIILNTSAVVSINVEAGSSANIIDNVTPATIYVPAELLEEYKSTSPWSNIASRIVAITNE